MNDAALFFWGYSHEGYSRWCVDAYKNKALVARLEMINGNLEYTITREGRKLGYHEDGELRLIMEAYLSNQLEEKDMRCDTQESSFNES